MKTSAQRQHDAETRQANADQAERIPTINERYDNGPAEQPIRNYHDLEAELYRQHAFNCEKQAKLDEIRTMCLRYRNPGVNIGAHALADTILNLIGRE
jgi:hypothetical protein